MRRSHTGFTLIELMIAVAILALLSAIAIGSYNDYIREAKTSKVIAHYRVAVDSVRFMYQSAHSLQSQGRPINPPLPTSSAEWATRLQSDSPQAPDGGPAFIAGAGDVVTGAIGIVSTGSWATQDSQVTVTRPAFAELATESLTIGQQRF